MRELEAPRLRMVNDGLEWFGGLIFSNYRAEAMHFGLVCEKSLAASMTAPDGRAFFCAIKHPDANNVAGVEFSVLRWEETAAHTFLTVVMLGRVRRSLSSTGPFGMSCGRPGESRVPQPEGLVP